MSPDELKAYLQSHTIFAGLDPAHAEILAKHAEEKIYAGGDMLFRQEDPAEHFYILLAGSIQVEVPSIMGPALVVQTLGADEVLGWSWLIPPFKWNFVAKSDLVS